MEITSIKNKCWERIDLILKHSGMNANQFAIHIGLPRGENLYQIKKGNNGISLKLAQRIVDKFPRYSLSWIIAGEGPMERFAKICAYPVEKVKGAYCRSLNCYGKSIGGECLCDRWTSFFNSLNN